MSFREVGAGLRGMVLEWAHDPSVRWRIVLDAWESSVGSALRDRARPVALQDDRLRVMVADAAWAAALREMEARLLDEINGALGRRVLRAIDWQIKDGGQVPSG